MRLGERNAQSPQRLRVAIVDGGVIVVELDVLVRHP
jgi:hypothetical protein